MNVTCIKRQLKVILNLQIKSDDFDFFWCQNHHFWLIYVKKCIKSYIIL